MIYKFKDILRKSMRAQLRESNQQSNDALMITSIEKSSMSAIDNTISVLSSQLENLKIYKQCVTDILKIQKTVTDTINNDAFSTYSQSHTLPGVVSIPQAHNYQGIKSESERIEQLSAEKEKIFNQKEIIFNLWEKDNQHYFELVKILKANNAHFLKYLEVLNGNIDPSLSPIQHYDNYYQKRPIIKVNVTKDYSNNNNTE